MVFTMNLFVLAFHSLAIHLAKMLDNAYIDIVPTPYQFVVERVESVALLDDKRPYSTLMF